VPFKSEAQRRKFYAMANSGAMSHETVREWEDATPKDVKLPERVVKKAYATGLNAALARHGLKSAACEEIRLKLPKREFHGVDAALRATARGEKRAEGPDAEMLAEALRMFDEPGLAPGPVAAQDPLERDTLWSGPSNLAAGDTANRASDMGQATQNGAI